MLFDYLHSVRLIHEAALAALVLVLSTLPNLGNGATNSYSVLTHGD